MYYIPTIKYVMQYSKTPIFINYYNIRKPDCSVNNLLIKSQFNVWIVYSLIE